MLVLRSGFVRSYVAFFIRTYVRTQKGPFCERTYVRPFFGRRRHVGSCWFMLVHVGNAVKDSVLPKYVRYNSQEKKLLFLKTDLKQN